jgi:pimeloyl-ACP methyl ester carboxylesterase
VYPPSTIIRVDGRRLAVEDSGPKDGFAVLLHSGTGSRHIFPGAVSDAERAGFRLISYDRPGLGQSDSQDGRRIVDAVVDVRAIVEELQIDRMAIWGSSGGGPYAVATAVGLSRIVSSVALFAPVGPYGTEDLDFTAGMDLGLDFRDAVALLFDDPASARKGFMERVNEILETQGSVEWWMSRWGDLAGRDDAHSIAWAQYLADCAIDGFGANGEGWWEDWCATFSPWGIDVTTVDIPIILWHGEDDQMVPVSHARWYASKLSRIELQLLPDIDHTNIDENLRSAAFEWTSRHSG